MRKVGLEPDGAGRPRGLEAVRQRVRPGAVVLNLFEASSIERLAERASLLGCQIGAGPKGAWSELAVAEQAMRRLR